MPRLLFLCLFMSLIFAGSVSGTDFTDAVGRRVSIPESPRRIISLVPSVTEILFKLGLEKQLVADTDACTYPAAAQKLPKVGNYAEPSLEAILLHKPDLVIAAADINRPALIHRLELLKIPVFVIHPRTVAETLSTIETLGLICGRAQQGKQLAASLRRRIEKLQKQIAGRPRPTTLGCVMLRPLTVAGPETLVDNIIGIAGGINVVPAGPSRYPTWNSEALLAANPQTIIVSTYPGQPDPEEYFSRWPQLRAVKEKRIIRIDADWIHRPGPRLILGIEALARGLHPGIACDE